MIFKLHYWCMAAGANALGILLGVFLTAYTDFTSTEIGLVYMLMPFCSMICRPIICSFADRKQAHRKYMISSLVITGLTYLPFVIIPLIGPQFYKTYPRLAGYTLLAFKIVGDISFSGASSMGDSLAINYAHRVGTNFGVYRVWATISWMVFGIVVSQINEVWFLPKYVPAFIILIMASLVDAFLIWLWPTEYFVMVPINQTNLKDESTPKKIEGESSNSSKTLLPRAVVWAHAKRKLWSIVTCSCWSGQDAIVEPTIRASNGSVSQLDNGGKGNSKSDSSEGIDRKTQMTILLLLLKRDPRVILYAMLFVCGGFTIVPLSFFFMSLSDICRETNACDFSQLAGFLQVSMASVETVLFVYIKTILTKIGRLNTVSIALALGFLKYGFYGTIWPSVNPYWSLISEIPHGLIFATYLVLMVELAHFFSSEVEYLIPELIERGIVKADDEAACEKLKLSLSATMQALMSSANDGIGRGMGALIYGILIDRYSYHTLWLIIAVGCGCVFIIVQTINILDNCLNLRLGLDEQFKKKMESREGESIRMAQIKEKALNMSDNFDSISVHSRDHSMRSKTTSTEVKMQQIA